MIKKTDNKEELKLINRIYLNRSLNMSLIYGCFILQSSAHDLLIKKIFDL